VHYDPIKKSLGNVFNKTPFLRKVFYKLLDLLLLRAWHVHKELKLWASQNNKNVEILDAGMGFGQHTYYLSNYNDNWKILAVDVKDEQVEDCKKFFNAIDKKNVHFEIADLTETAYFANKQNKFDLALSVDVMEHILEDVLVFKNIVSSLKVGGMLLISTPSDQGGSDVNDEDGTSFIEEHVRDGYNIKEIEDKLKSAGFSKVEARYSYGAPGKISWRLSMKYPIQILGVSKIFFLIIIPYYILTFPISYILNWFDVNGKHTTGTGLIVKAWK